VEAQAPRSRLSMWSISMPACKSPHLGGGGFVGGHMRLGHSPRLHNAGVTISFRGAEMHFVREASADFSCLPGNHPGAASLWERAIESRRPREPPGRRHGGKGSAVLGTPPFDRDTNKSGVCSFRRTPGRLLRGCSPASPYRTLIGSRRRCR
jgi:hypothetical protein